MADYQTRLRNAYFAHNMESGYWLMPFKEEIVSLARANGPFDTTISLSNAQRLENNERAVAKEGFWVECPEDVPYRLHPGLRILARRQGKLTNGMVYVVGSCDADGAEVEETILRFGETERKRISVTLEQLEKNTTLAAGITVAGCQGKTLGRTRVQNISSDFMSAENLIVCTNRTRTLRDMRCDP